MGTIALLFFAGTLGGLMMIAAWGSLSFAALEDRMPCFMRWFVGATGTLVGLSLPILVAAGWMSGNRIPMRAPESYMFCAAAYIAFVAYTAWMFVEARKERYWCNACSAYRRDHYNTIQERGGILRCGHQGRLAPE